MHDPTRSRNLPSPPEPVNDPPNRTRLTDLRLPLRASAEAVRTQLRAGFLHAGRELVRARELCKHGEWLPYLEACGVPERAARRMIQAARAIDAGIVPPDLSLRATLAAVTKPRPAPPPAAKPYRPTGPVLDMAAVDRLTEQYRAAGDPGDVAHRAMIAQHVLQTGRAPSAAWFDDDPCDYCDCFPAGSTMAERADAWAAWKLGKGPEAPDPWKCPKGARRWRCEAEGDAADA